MDGEVRRDGSSGGAEMAVASTPSFDESLERLLQAADTEGLDLREVDHYVPQRDGVLDKVGGGCAWRVAQLVVHQPGESRCGDPGELSGDAPVHISFTGQSSRTGRSR